MSSNSPFSAAAHRAACPASAIIGAHAIPPTPEPAQALRAPHRTERREGQTSALVDTTPDLRQQLLDAGTRGSTACSTPMTTPITPTASTICARLPTTAIAASMSTTTRRRAGSSARVSPIVSTRRLQANIRRSSKVTRSCGEAVRIAGAGGAIEALPFRQIHGSGESLGFRFGGLAYSPDVSDFPEESLEALTGLDIWILDTLRYKPHPSHLSVEQALGWVARMKPKRAVLTHMHVDLDYERLKAELPEGVEPAYDGMVLSEEG